MKRSEQRKLFKKYVEEDLVKVYHLSEFEAHRAVHDSYLSQGLREDPHFVDHDTIEEWADIVYREYTGDFDPNWQNREVLQM